MVGYGGQNRSTRPLDIGIDVRHIAEGSDSTAGLCEEQNEEPREVGGEVDGLIYANEDAEML
ncbi:hypothetical protein HETIRDRAFT_411248 [Heterobasidion irregulare TC 32-1]|uniref:Uncharacterized protein n=1 Tax=Heterobasidion irregulare (strain TC 32-1) TaxID=747525 RepID=W4JWZ1_HETIT|nr:uncharacterized protein HETIRDRAFT_411248 [Heterobasidion irregulare TC 32-1]ETW78077.1 hypothetical protein HETIRDRAFT_411248 [Heterobasidion irregulare TC 32-1]